ncbi:phosphonate C-P lyase system protein PhnL [Brenneria corticis]|uniref:Phosphonate C-P lyase system protein PhnL n=1 Tax=Brenneria corticis TaxID=2173106 RepID=A0A2U1TXA0_9GAMM|nr:phosphonate C-P lyase system protein PhnL [Brenneria sp. CFCC 11842]PWC14036.1 phosphonate C-P lyase system protein PhnL [Brenneria sp. CFCC 11842]
MCNSTSEIQIAVENLSKTFVLHNQQGVRLPVLSAINLQVKKGQCMALHGHSGCGKSTLLRSLYANYQADAGHIWINHRQHPVDIVTADARTIFAIRRETLGWVSQFLRVIPRISTLNVVMQPLLEQGVEKAECAERAEQLLSRLRIPSRLWSLAPSTFSGGEQQRINIARGFITDYPILLLDEPTASLDDKNRHTVAALIEEAKLRGTAIIGIFHDREIRERVADSLFTMPDTVSDKEKSHDYQ